MNGFDVIVKEDSGFVGQVAQVTQEVFQWVFRWVGEGGHVLQAVANGEARYNVVLEASQPCDGIHLNEAHMDPPSIESWLYFKSLSEIERKVKEETAAPAPAMKVANGTLIESSSGYHFFVTADDLQEYTQVRTTQTTQTSDDRLTTRSIVICSGVALCALVLLCALAGGILVTKSRRELLSEERNILERKITEIEEKGVELPDDLKKVKSKFAKSSDPNPKL